MIGSGRPTKQRRKGGEKRRKEGEKTWRRAVRGHAAALLATHRAFGWQL
jgi:hypothetical protein